MHKKLKAIIIGLFTGICNGFLGAGGGTILVPSMEKFLKVEEHKAHATSLGVILPLSIISAYLYTTKTNIDWISILYVSIGGVIGGYIGATFLGKVSKKWLHILFGLFMILAGAKSIL